MLSRGGSFGGFSLRLPFICCIRCSFVTAIRSRPISPDDPDAPEFSSSLEATLYGSSSGMGILGRFLISTGLWTATADSQAAVKEREKKKKCAYQQVFIVSSQQHLSTTSMHVRSSARVHVRRSVFTRLARGEEKKIWKRNRHQVGDLIAKSIDAFITLIWWRQESERRTLGYVRTLYTH